MSEREKIQAELLLRRDAGLQKQTGGVDSKEQRLMMAELLAAEADGYSDDLSDD